MVSTAPVRSAKSSNVKLIPQSWSLFHDASGQIKSDTVVVQANVLCKTSDIEKIAYELEHRTFIGPKAFHFSELNRASMRRTAKAWSSWYAEHGYKIAPFAIRAFKPTDAIKCESTEPAYKTYNRQAKLGVLSFLKHNKESLSLKVVNIAGYLDHHNRYNQSPVSSDHDDDNLPIYFPESLKFHSLRELGIHLGASSFELVKHKYCPRDYCGKARWRMVQLADLLAGVCRQAILNTDNKPIKMMLGAGFRELTQSERYSESKCIFECYDLGPSKWSPSSFEPFESEPVPSVLPPCLTEQGFNGCLDELN